MNAICKTETERRLGSPTLLYIYTLRSAGLVAALILLSASPSYAVSWYSGASVGSDGTVYGWGVTDGTSYTMYHVAYVTTTLASPVKHRQATLGQHSAQNMVREDVSLPFDAGDLGIYFVTSTHYAYCYAALYYFINGAQSQASANNAAYPINFRLDHAWDAGGGLLAILYKWDSSSGNWQDLADCVVYEVVSYPNGGHSPYVWPKPPWNQSTDNPTISGVPGTDLRFEDDIKPGTFVKPYAENGFSSTQDYRYTCHGGSEVTLQGSIINSRSVKRNTNSSYRYEVSSRGYSDSINPLP
jgi:hypothetical protein